MYQRNDRPTTALDYLSRCIDEILDDLAGEILVAGWLDPPRRRAAILEAKRQLYALLHGGEAPAPSEIFRNRYAQAISSSRAPERAADLESFDLLNAEIMGHFAADLDDEP